MPNIMPADEGVPTNPGHGFDADGSIDALSHDVQEQAAAFRAGHPGIEVLDVRERQAVFRLASRGILRRLSDQGVKGAYGLLSKLDAAAETDGFADIYNVAERLRRAELIGAELGDVNAQSEHGRLGLLADAVGGTASAVVASVLTPEGAGYVVNRARSMVAEYRSGSKRDPSKSILGSLLDKVESRQPGGSSGPETTG